MNAEKGVAYSDNKRTRPLLGGSSVASPHLPACCLLWWGQRPREPFSLVHNICHPRPVPSWRSRRHNKSAFICVHLWLNFLIHRGDAKGAAYKILAAREQIEGLQCRDNGKNERVCF